MKIRKLHFDKCNVLALGRVVFVTLCLYLIPFLFITIYWYPSEVYPEVKRIITIVAAFFSSFFAMLFCINYERINVYLYDKGFRNQFIVCRHSIYMNRYFKLMRKRRKRAKQLWDKLMNDVEFAMTMGGFFKEDWTIPDE